MEPEDDDDIEGLKWAFERGYRQGRNDEKEGIFIDWSSILEHFLASLKRVRFRSTDKENHIVK